VSGRPRPTARQSKTRRLIAPRRDVRERGEDPLALILISETARILYPGSMYLVTRATLFHRILVRRTQWTPGRVRHRDPNQGGGPSHMSLWRSWKSSERGTLPLTPQNRPILINGALRAARCP